MIHDYKPVGLSVLPYLQPLKQFEIFSGKGLLDASKFVKKEEEWILKPINQWNHTQNQNSS